MNRLKPLTFGQSCLYFGASALVFRLAVYNLLPFLRENGVSAFTAFIGSYTSALGLLFEATFYALGKEGNLAAWQTRLRLRQLAGRQVLLCLGLFAGGFLATGLLLPTAKLLAATRLLAPPDFLPDLLNPNKTVPGQSLTSFLGVPLAGAYWVVAVYFIFLTLFNILGEEV